MYEEALANIGLTQNEIKVYLALLKLGASSTGPLVQASQISSGKIYETLHKLVEKGLVEIAIENGIKKFHTTDPKSLLLYMEERQKTIVQQAKSIEHIVPELAKLKQLEPSHEGVFLIKGLRGIKPIVYEVLEQACGEFKIMGVRSSKQRMYNTFWAHWHTERVNKGKNARLLFVDKGTSYWNFFQKLKHTQTRTLSSLTPSAIMVIDEHCFIFSYDPEFTCVHIISKSTAQSLGSFFESLWASARR